MLKGIKFDNTLLLAMVTSLFYTWSTASFNGFLSVMRLDSDLMERNFHQVIYNGMLISFGPILTAGLLIWAIIFFYSHAILPSYIDWVRGGFGRRRQVVRFRRFWFAKRNSPRVESRAKELFTKISLAMILSLFYIFSLAYFESTSSGNAKKLLEEHESGKNSQASIINVEINKKSKKLRFLACGSRTCAGIEEKTNLIYYFSSTTSYSYIHHEKNVTKPST